MSPPRAHSSGLPEVSARRRSLIVRRLDSLGRSLGDLIRLTFDLKAREVGFPSLTEQIDTRSPSGELVFHVFGARSLA